MKQFDRDHAFWTESHWTATKEANTLRTMGSLIIRLDRIVHEAKHRDTPAIPLLGYHTLKRTLSLYQPGATPLESIDNVMSAIETASNTPKAHEIEKDQARLTVWALELGKPYWAESPDEPRATVIDLADYRSSRTVYTSPQVPGN